MTTPAAVRSGGGRLGRRRGGDEGSVLIFVLVLMVIAGLIVVPLLSYTATVLRANRVVSSQTKQSEAVKAGLRVALSNPRRIFKQCDNSTTLASTNVNSYNVTTTCVELEEVTPSFAGFEVPIGATALQLGQDVRDTFSGGVLDSGPVPPYPPSADWWTGSESTYPTSGKIWMPNLPRWPSIERTSVALQMPGFSCQVFLPGHYVDEIVLDTGKYAFASGVYYFAKSVTVKGDADVIVGQGLEEFADGCADNQQIAGNVTGDIGRGYGIVGGGATWVFGKAGRLIVDDTGGGAPSLRFNQRYDTVDRGGRINIMTVNGDERTGGDHDVPDVNFMPRSLVQNAALDPTLDPDDPAQPPPEVIAPGTYEPSSIVYTDAARPPAAPPGLTVDAYTYDSGAKGLLVVEWDEVIGQATRGAVIERYDVSVSPGPSPVCEPDDQFITAGPTPADPRTFMCVVDDLDPALGVVTVEVSATNDTGGGDKSTVIADFSTATPVAPPAAPTNVQVVDGDTPGIAQVSWDPPITAIPVEEYTVTAVAVGPTTVADVPPVADDLTAVVAPGGDITVHLPAHDPNGDPLSVTSLDLAPLAADAPGFPPGSVVVTGLDVTIRPDAIAAGAVYDLTYEVTDGTTPVTANLRLAVDAAPPATPPPVAHPMTLDADVGVVNSTSFPATHERGEALTITVDATDLTFADPTATVTVSGFDVDVTTVAADGTYALTYEVTGASGTVTETFDVSVGRDATATGTCVSTPVAGMPAQPSCEIPALPDLPPSAPAAGFGYRFDVVATNGAGDSAIGSTTAPFPTAFNGTGTALPALPTPLPPRNVVPWVPDPVIEIRASGAGKVRVQIPGYVAVPMGRIVFDNPNCSPNCDATDPKANPVGVTGGALAGTFDVVDGREVAGLAESVWVGYRNDIVLQRKVRIVSVAGTSKSVAIVQVNEDLSYAVNEWFVS